MDSCVWGPTAAPLRDAGHDVVWAGACSIDPGDEAILRFAFEERRVLHTLDKDFGELIVARGPRHAGMIRLRRIPVRQQAIACLRVITSHANDLEAGAIITVEPGRIRVRQSDVPNGHGRPDAER
ncbi:MAG: DUF5615 family PIN-like protein [Dehalococcoidia bacterium]